MPDILKDLATMINRMPATVEFQAHWKRLRIAVTPDEWEEIRQYYREETNGDFVAMAIRGVPVLIEANPTNYPIPLQARTESIE